MVFKFCDEKLLLLTSSCISVLTNEVFWTFDSLMVGGSARHIPGTTVQTTDFSWIISGCRSHSASFRVVCKASALAGSSVARKAAQKVGGAPGPTWVASPWQHSSHFRRPWHLWPWRLVLPLAHLHSNQRGCQRSWASLQESRYFRAFINH